MADLSSVELVDALYPHEVALFEYALMHDLVDLPSDVAARVHERYSAELVPALERAQAASVDAGSVASRSVRDHVWLAGVIAGEVPLDAGDRRELDGHVADGIEVAAGAADDRVWSSQLDAGGKARTKARRQLQSIGFAAGFAVAAVSIVSLTVAGVSLEHSGVGLGAALLTISHWGSAPAAVVASIAGEELMSRDDRVARRAAKLEASTRSADGRPRVLHPDEVLARLEMYLAPQGPFQYARLLPVSRAAVDTRAVAGPGMG